MTISCKNKAHIYTLMEDNPVTHTYNIGVQNILHVTHIRSMDYTYRLHLYESMV